MGPARSGKTRSTKCVFGKRRLTAWRESRKERPARDLVAPEPDGNGSARERRTAPQQVLDGESAGSAFGLFAPLVPGGANRGSGGLLGDAMVLALGAMFASGWALLAAASLLGFVLDAGGEAFGR
jgi:hypothetical protein